LIKEHIIKIYMKIEKSIEKNIMINITKKTKN